MTQWEETRRRPVLPWYLAALVWPVAALALPISPPWALGVRAVFCNGAAAARLYARYLQPVTGLAAVRLPSTSPANAACSPQALRRAWGAALAPYLPAVDKL